MKGIIYHAVPTGPHFPSLETYDGLIRDGWAQAPAHRPAFEVGRCELKGLETCVARAWFQRLVSAPGFSAWISARGVSAWFQRLVSVPGCQCLGFSTWVQRLVSTTTM